MPIGTQVAILLFLAAQLIAVVIGVVKALMRLNNTVTVSECVTRHEATTERIHGTEKWRAAVDERLLTLYKAMESIRNGGHAHANPHPTNGFPEWPGSPEQEE